MVNQLRSGAIEERVNVHHRCIGRKKGYSKTPKVGMPASVNENVRLGEREGVSRKVEKGPYGLNILMDHTPVV